MIDIPQQLRKVCLSYLQALDTPRSLAVFLMVKNREWDQLLSLRIDPANYLDVTASCLRFARDYAATELLRKFDGLPSSADKKGVAVAAFHSCEHQCKLSNDRLRSLRDGSLAGPLDARALSILERARKIIGDVLGKLPDDLDCRFGPGATFESSSWPESKTLTVMDKIQNQPSVTSDGAYLARHLLDDSAWERSGGSHSRLSPLFVRGNRFTTVPKDATKDRGIAIEPGLNIWIQLGIGSAIRRRLRRVGVDLQEGQSLHNELARRASIDGGMATIDLSNASDTVGKELVSRLLPPDWYQLLDDARSRFTRLGGTWYRLEKFSSMGNGFTFELETLVFYALSLAAGATSVSVYGDDIIVNSSSGADVISVLRFFGFTPNPRKTFLTGAFRESCGGDYFLGWKCSPLRIRKDPVTPTDWIDLANGIWASSQALRCSSALRARSIALGEIPVPVRSVRGPRALGSLVIWSSFDTWSPSLRWRGSGIGYLRVLRPIPYRVPLRYFSPLVQLAGALYGVSSSGPSPRDRVSGYKLGWKAWS